MEGRYQRKGDHRTLASSYLFVLKLSKKYFNWHGRPDKRGVCKMFIAEFWDIVLG